VSFVLGLEEVAAIVVAVAVAHLYSAKHRGGDGLKVLKLNF
jgi:hypothetical protein